MAEFPNQPFSLCGPKDTQGKGNKLFCDACTCELSLVKSTITDHCGREKHKNNVLMKAHLKKSAARIEDSMKVVNKEVALSLTHCTISPTALSHTLHSLTLLVRIDHPSPVGTPCWFHHSC
jgi:hypothetical protein